MAETNFNSYDWNEFIHMAIRIYSYRYTNLFLSPYEFIRITIRIYSYHYTN